LKVVKELDPQSLEVLVPSMLLQPLVENSIKHGLASKIEGGSIHLRSRIVNSKLFVEVEDDGVGMRASHAGDGNGLAGMGIGMSNIAERLQVLYGDTAAMTVDSEQGRGTLVRLRIPLLQEGSVAAALYEERSSTRR
jgi:two-component system LytT family sensor kinase